MNTNRKSSSIIILSPFIRYLLRLVYGPGIDFYPKDKDDIDY